MSFRPFKPFRGFGGGAVQSAFDPLTLSPAVWLSDSGADPAVWPDISGNGRSAAQATAANQPAIIAAGLNGRQIRRFDGVTEFMTTDYSRVGSKTVFLLAKSIGSGIKRVLAFGNGAYSLGSFGGGGNWGWYQNSEGGITTIPQAYSVWSILCLKFTSNISVAAFANGAFLMDFTGENIAGVLVVGTESSGGANVFDGDIAEILVFPTALSDTDREAVEAYLNEKWAIY